MEEAALRTAMEAEDGSFGPDPSWLAWPQLDSPIPTRVECGGPDAGSAAVSSTA